MMTGLRFRLVSVDKAVANYNKTLAGSPAYHCVAIVEGRIVRAHPANYCDGAAKVTLGFMRIGANS
jgi:hypothetical protein